VSRANGRNGDWIMTDTAFMKYLLVYILGFISAALVILIML